MGVAPAQAPPLPWELEDARALQAKVKDFLEAEKRLLKAKSDHEVVEAAKRFAETGVLVARSLKSSIPPALKPFYKASEVSCFNCEG